MRTRFLTTDYFTTNQTVAFLRLPLSPLPSSHDHLSSFDGLLPCCTDYSANSVTFQLENLPIDDALVKFYADVLPQTIDFQIPEKEAGLCYEKKAAQSCLASDSETSENQFTGERHKDIIGDSHENEGAIIQFETLELTQNLEYAQMLEKEEEVQFLLEVQDCDDDLEILNLVPTDQFAIDIVDRVCSVEAMHLEYDMTLKSQISDEAEFLQNDIPLSATVLPLLEVEEIEPSHFACLCLEDECGSLFETIEGQHSALSIDLELCCQDLLVSMEIDILEHIFNSHSSKLPLEFCFPSLTLALDIDLLQVLETRYSEKNTGFVDACLIPCADIFLLEEFMMLDSESFDIFEVHATCQTTEENELCNMFGGDMPFKSFDELIVSCELAIIDGSFTSLPVPDLVDDEKICSLHVLVDHILTELEPVPLSTSDEIYLDWHLLGKDECSGDVNAAIEKVFRDIEDYTMGFGSNFDDGSVLLFDFLFSDDPSVILNIGESKVSMPSKASCTAELHNDKVVSIDISDEDCQTMDKIRGLTDEDFEKLASGKLFDDDCQLIENDGIRDVDYHKLVVPVKSLHQFNDLDFFLNPQKATDGMKTGKKINPQEAKSMPSKDPLIATSSSSSIQMQRFGIQLHTLILPTNINVLIENHHRSYLKIFRNDIQQGKTELPVTSSNDMSLLKLSEQKLMDQCRLSQQKSFTGHVDDNALDFVALCAIKRMTWCLCFFGVYSLHQFLCKLFQSLGFLKPRLSFLCSLIEDAYQVVDREVIKSHPSLHAIKKLLLQNNNKRGRVLIIAQQVLWEPLKRLLNSMDVSFSEVDPFVRDYQSGLDYEDFVSGSRHHIQTTCLLVPHEHVSLSILVQKVDIIVEYGGPRSFSKVSTHCREYIGSQTIHFMKVELDDVAKAMCEGVIVTSDDRDTVNLEAVLNFGLIKENFYEVHSEASGGTTSCSIPMPMCHMAQNSERFHPCNLSFQDMPIIINTQNSDKEMIISRRMTYQKILAMEKRGVQVVERDLILPVDIILDSTMCIVWYDCKNMLKKVTVQDEDASSVPLCIEHIAANVLTSLSFAFTTCILIFEGDCKFLVSAMESADELYAAAASLGTCLQIFYSSSSELTDEIILNYIGHFRNRYKGLLSRLPDSETLAESFLSKFPSINPLSAHAIISSGCKLLEFFELTVEGRVHALRKYHASDESVSLFSALCKYGEREDSKSGLTDCSSSVSSPPDSGNFVYKINSDDRKRKFVASSCDNEFGCSRPSKKYVDKGLVDQAIFRSYDPEESKGPRINLQKKLPDFLLNDELFCEGDAPYTAINIDPSNTMCETNINGVPKDPVMEDGFDRSTLHVNDGFPVQPKSDRTIKNKREEIARSILKDLDKGFADEVDFYDKSLFDGDLQSDDFFLKPSPMVSENVKFHAPRYNRTARRLSFGNGSDQNIQMADEMDTYFMLEDDRQLRADNDFNGVEYKCSNSSCKGQEREEQKGRTTLEKSVQKFSGQFLRGKNVPSCGETPFSKAVQSREHQEGSPWTIEFLNRIKEKRKLRQQSQPYASIPHTGYHGSTAKATKRRSASILEYYKYQSDNKPKNLVGQKMQKQNAQLRNERPQVFRPICTPIDKRARRSLSFATNGTGSQTKLVWGSNISCSQDSGFSS